MNYQELRDEIKTAMKAKDKVRLAILRQVLGEIKNIEVNERREITDADVDAMLKRTIKQTKETLDGSIKAGNDQERTDTLAEQVKILEEYLPKQVSGEELSALIGEVLAETGATTKKEMGRVMGALTQKTGGIAHLGIEVVIFNPRTQFNFLDVNGFLIFSGFLFSLCLFKAIFAIVHNLTYGRSCLRSNLNKVKILFKGNFLCVLS